MLGNMPIIESREEVYCNSCQSYTEQWKKYKGNGHQPYDVLGLVRDILEGRGDKPEPFTGCRGCVTVGVYGDKKLIASMKKLRAGVDAKTREVIEQSVGEFLAGMPVDV
jgi:hypothetical protein